MVRIIKNKTNKNSHNNNLEKNYQLGIIIDQLIQIKFNIEYFYLIFSKNLFYTVMKLKK